MDKQAKTKEMQISEALSEGQAALFGVVYVLTGGSQDAMDILQETNLAILQNTAEYDPATPMKNWFRQMAMRQVIAYRRKRRSEKLVFDSDLLGQLAETVAALDGKGDKSELQRETDLASLDDCFKKLPEWQRSLLMDRYDAGRRVDDLAKERHVTCDSLSVLMFRIRKALHDCIAKRRKGAEKEDGTRGFIVDLERVLDGDAPTEVAARLAESIRTTASLRETYVKHTQMHALLLYRHRELFAKMRAEEARRQAGSGAKIAAAVAGLALLAFGTALLANRGKTLSAANRPAASNQQGQTAPTAAAAGNEQAAAPSPRENVLAATESAPVEKSLLSTEPNPSGGSMPNKESRVQGENEMKTAKQVLASAMAVTAAVAMTSATANGADLATFDAGQALKADLAGTPSNPYTDANGGVWTFGRAVAALHASVQAFTSPFTTGGLTGYADSGTTFTVPCTLVNSTAEPLMYTDASSFPIAPGEILLHPADVSENTHCTAIRFTVPHSGFYEAAVEVRDLSAGNDGVTASLAVNGKIFSADSVNLTQSITNATLRLSAQYVAKGGTIDLIVDPLANHYNDSTGLFFSIKELQRMDCEPVVDVDAMFRNNLLSASPVMPYTENGSTLSCGTISNWYFRPFTVLTTTVTPGSYAFSNKENFPFVSANTNETPFTYYGISAGNYLMPGEIMMHPNPAEDTLVGVTAPSSGVYRAVAVFRDLNTQISDDGIWAGILYNNACCLATNIVSDGTNYPTRIVSADGISLAAGDSVSFFVNQNVVHYRDTTALQAYLFPDATGDDASIVNMDFNGYYADDPTPTATNTYHGAGRIGSTNACWNAITVKDSTVSRISMEHMKLANGKTSLVNFTLTASEGKTLGADMLPRMGPNVLGNDYLYTHKDATNTFTLSGLFPNQKYTLYLYGGNRYVLNTSRFNIGGEEKGGNPLGWFLQVGDYTVYSDVEADANGCITGTEYSANSDGVFCGFQLTGKIPRPPAGLVIKLL